MVKKYGFLICFVLIGFSNVFSQQIDSTKVLMSEISKSYKGKSKNGLADGKGTAKGEDSYTGEFKNGLPDGKGKYTYKNGNNFTGYFSEGLKNGKGTFNYSINGNWFSQKGYWVKGDYVGTTNPDEFYVVSNITGIESYSIKKLDENKDVILLSITSGSRKFVPANFNIKTTSGQLYSQGNSLQINNYNLPVNCEVDFTIKMGNINKECHFIFEILKQGNYEVLINAN